MKLSKEELIYLKHATTDIGRYGIFDCENNTPKGFKEEYGITKSKTISASESIHQKVLIELKKYIK